MNIIFYYEPDIAAHITHFDTKGTSRSRFIGYWTFLRVGADIAGFLGSSVYGDSQGMLLWMISLKEVCRLQEFLLFWNLCKLILEIVKGRTICPCFHSPTKEVSARKPTVRHLCRDHPHSSVEVVEHEARKAVERNWKKYVLKENLC